MAKGIDCATPLTAATAKAFASDGFTFACRYLVPYGWKRLTREEAEAISNAGLQIVSVFETTANRPLTGRDGGLNDGASALQTAKEIGQPEGSTIYFAVDFDATAAEMPLVIEYIRAASEATPGYNTGVYGSYSVVEAIRAAGVCSRYWQTKAWSRGVLSSSANIHQYDCGPDGLGLELNGIGVDLNDSFGNEGWWNTLEPVEEDKQKMKAEDANKIIEFLKAGFGVVEDHPDAREEFRRLANELRKVSGQPEE